MSHIPFHYVERTISEEPAANIISGKGSVASVNEAGGLSSSEGD